MHLITKAAIGALVAGSFGVWGYAYSGLADRPLPDLLDEPAFAVAAESVCSDAKVRFDALPNAETAVDNVDRAAQIVDRNAVLTSMLDDLTALSDAEAGTERDVEMRTEWLLDWRTYVAERADYAERFALDETEVLYVSANGGERLERRITRFANTNEMYSCITPTDVG